DCTERNVPRESRRCGSAAQYPYTWPKKLTSMIRRSSSVSYRYVSAYTVTIAFATYVSIRPKRSSACSTTCPTSSCTEWSAGTAIASVPNASASRTQASRPSAPRAVTTSFAPRRAAPRATARPSPLEAPVTTTTWSDRGFFVTTPESPILGEGKRCYSRAHERFDPALAHRLDPLDRAAALRRQASSGDRSLARFGHAGVQGLHHRQHAGGSSRAAAAAGDDDRSFGDAERTRARDRLAGHETPAPPPRLRRGGDARRAPGRAALADLHHARRGRRVLDRRVRLPRPRARLAEPAASGRPPPGDDARRHGAV